MTKRMLVGVFALMFSSAACSTEDENPAPNKGSTGETTAKLSASYASQCARCHGDEGKGSFQYPALPGARDEASFIALVRQGRSGTLMPSFAATTISDADLKADFLWMTTER